MPHCKANPPTDEENVKLDFVAGRPEKTPGALSGPETRMGETVERRANTAELMASNRELQAMNEKLRKVTEKLETSRRELQSINEELTRVNRELKAKVDELGKVNSDLHNLMNAAAIATVFLDRELRIMRYTPAAVSLFHLIPTGLGRPLADLRLRVEYPELIQDAERVLQTLVPVEREVHDAAECWFMVRLVPYRTVDDHIGGVVLTFVDVTERRRSEADLRARNDELERFNNVAVNREIRMIELKEEVNAALERAGEVPRYKLELNWEGSSDARPDV